MRILDLAERAYTAYARSVDGDRFRPTWRDLPAKTRNHWCAAAEAILSALRAETMSMAETREIEPTPDGWRQYETTGRVVLVVSPDDAAAVRRAFLAALGDV